MAYSEKVIDHYENPRNVGTMDKDDINVGTGMVGAPACGDVMKLQIKIDENDQLIGVVLTNGENDVMLSTKKGKAIRFHEKGARTMGRVSRGVRGIRLAEDDIVVSIDIVDGDATMMAITENGFGKRTSFDEYRPQTRGGKGVISIQTTERNGDVVSAHAVTDQHGILLITEGGQVTRIGANGLRVIGRNTQGVTIFNLKEKDRLVSAARLDPEEIIDSEEND